MLSLTFLFTGKTKKKKKRKKRGYQNNFSSLAKQTVVNFSVLHVKTLFGFLIKSSFRYL